MVHMTKALGAFGTARFKCFLVWVVFSRIRGELGHKFGALPFLEQGGLGVSLVRVCLYGRYTHMGSHWLQGLEGL